MSSGSPKKRARKDEAPAAPSYVDTLKAMIARDASDAEILRFAKIPMIQKPAPAFTCDAVLPDEEFSTISLSDYTSAGKWLVLFYYPLDFTFVCPTEIIAYSEAASQFQAVGCEVLAASCDSKHSHLAWMKTARKDGGLGEMKIPILADFNKSIATEYGCLLEGGEDNGVPCRAVFIIDPKGTVRHITMNDPPVGRNVDETLRLVKGYQYTDEHGEVCPANWTPGDATMVADPKKSKEGYFSKKHK